MGVFLCDSVISIHSWPRFSVSFKTRLLTSYPSNHTDAAAPKLTLFNQLNASRYPYLLSSSAVRQNNTQYDILLAFPQYTLTLNADKSLHCTDETLLLSAGFFATLENFYQKNKVLQSHDNEGLPFCGGWFVYLAYEMAEEIEPRLSLPALPAPQPLAVAARCPAAIIVDKKKRQVFAVAEDEYAHLLDEIEQDFIRLKDDFELPPVAAERIELKSLIEADTAPYLQQVEKIKQYIVDGDIFFRRICHGNGRRH